MAKILCVAEKPSIAKAVAEHLSGRHMQSVSLLPGSNHLLLTRHPSTKFEALSTSVTMSSYTTSELAGAIVPSSSLLLLDI